MQLLVSLRKLTFLPLSNNTHKKLRSPSLTEATTEPQSLATIAPLSLIKTKTDTERLEADCMNSVVSDASTAADLAQRVARELKDLNTLLVTAAIPLRPTETKEDLLTKLSALDAVALDIKQVSISLSVALVKATTLA